MKLNLLLSAAAVVCLTWPAAALADPPANQGGGADQGGQGPDKAKDQGPTGQNGQRGQKGQDASRGGHAGQGAAAVAGAARDTAATTPTPVAPTPQRGQAFRQQNGRGQSGGGDGQGAAAGSASTRGGAAVYAPTPDVSRAQRGRAFQQQQQEQHGNGSAAQGPSAGSGSQNFRAQPGQPRSGQRQVGHAMQPPANQPALAHWDRSVTGQARDQAGQQWRQTNSGWNTRAPWRSNTNWWRGNSAFRQYGGVRVGFFFIPAFGYVSAPAQYRERHWRSGEQLPNWFWRYGVRDYWDYGLPQPPDGCGWVWVNDDVALIDLSDGYILDIEHNVW
jgi:Ni/Co efflux regulator RcnB